jgi:uncharacterized protein (DUF934 family)
MPNLINKTEVIEDTWTQVDSFESLTSASGTMQDKSNVLLPWSVFTETLLATGVNPAATLNIGVIVPNTTSPEEILANKDALGLIAIEFPVFTDGRGYSLARILRESGYTGELRATGDVLPDQLFYMARCGFDTFSLKSDKDAATALQHFQTFSVTYQAAEDIKQPIYHR